MFQTNLIVLSDLAIQQEMSVFTKEFVEILLGSVALITDNVPMKIFAPMNFVLKDFVKLRETQIQQVILHVAKKPQIVQKDPVL